jgi:hypothetical protein
MSRNTHFKIGRTTYLEEKLPHPPVCHQHFNATYTSSSLNISTLIDKFIRYFLHLNITIHFFICQLKSEKNKSPDPVSFLYKGNEELLFLKQKNEWKRKKMLWNVKKRMGTRKNASERKKMNGNGKKWSGPGKNDLNRKKIGRNISVTVVLIKQKAHFRPISQKAHQ